MPRTSCTPTTARSSYPTPARGAHRAIVAVGEIADAIKATEVVSGSGIIGSFWKQVTRNTSTTHRRIHAHSKSPAPIGRRTNG
jgi:hypothetical protein